MSSTRISESAHSTAVTHHYAPHSVALESNSWRPGGSKSALLSANTCCTLFVVGILLLAACTPQDSDTQPQRNPPTIPAPPWQESVETVSLDDLDTAANLLAEFLSSLSGDEDFTP